MRTPSFSIYNASAGAGKTFTLVKEYLKILLLANRNDAYRSILALTFTNKAVGEMKHRIVDNLSEFTKEKPKKQAWDMMKILEQETGLSLSIIKTKSKNIIKNLIHNYAAFDVLTIDKFTHKVIRAFAHDLNLPTSFDVTLETDSLLQEAVDNIVAKAGEDDALTALLIAFSIEKTDHDKNWDVTQEILNTAKLLINDNNRHEVAHFKNKSIAEFIHIKKTLYNLLLQHETKITTLSKKTLQTIDNHQIEHATFYREYIPKYLKTLSEGRIEKKEHLLKYLEINNRYAKAKPVVQQQAIDMIANDLIANFEFLFQWIEKYCFYKAFLKNITPLSLLNVINQEFLKIQKEQNTLSISEFNTIIYNEIQNQPAPFIYERLGERYRHFFIDEFQDTSEMQWLNLIPLIENALVAEDHNQEKGTLMIVGDPKQSIYRWRGGKAEQFISLNKTHNPFVNPDKVSIQLNKNYRSHSEIVTFNNAFFGWIAKEFDHLDYKDLYANQSYQNTNDKIGGYVELSFISKEETKDYDTVKNQTENSTTIDNRLLYLKKTTALIKTIKEKGFEYKDIIILTRKREQGTAIAQYLAEQSIPITSSDSLMISRATTVSFIINVVHYLENKTNSIAKASLLQYIGTYNQNQIPIHDFIITGMKYEEKTTTPNDKLVFDDQKTKLNKENLETWLATFHIKIDFGDLRKKALYEMAETIIDIFLKSYKNNAYIQYFLDIVLEYDLKNQSGISDFLNYWTKNAHRFSIPSPEGNNAIQIMTIHKSKGLEFPIVIFPFAEEDYSRGIKDKLWLDNDESCFNLPKVLIDNNNSIETFGETAQRVYKQKKQEELLDNINILYVALTRAKEQLYILSTMNLSSKEDVLPKNMSSFFIHYLQHLKLFDKEKWIYTWGNSTKVSENQDPTNEIYTIPILPNYLDFNRIKIAQKASTLWQTKQQDAIAYGNSIHEILSSVYIIDNIDLAVTRAIEIGLISNNQKNTIYKTIHTIVTHPKLSHYFNKTNQIYNEQIIIENEGHMIKPDKLVIDQNRHAYILDYKTGKPNNSYKNQLNNYQKIIEKMNYKVMRKTLVYIGEILTIDEL